MDLNVRLQVVFMRRMANTGNNGNFQRATTFGFRQRDKVIEVEWP